MGGNIKCSVCGKFIAYKDFDDKKVIVGFIPDTEFTTERTEFTHNECENK